MIIKGNFLKYVLVVIVITIQVTMVKAQLVTDVIDISKDSYVKTPGTTNNYGNSNSMYAGSLTQLNPPWIGGSTTYLYRLFIEADLSSIPADAIIESATLEMYASWVGNSQTHPFYLSRSSGSWSESSITWSNQPGEITSDQISVPHADVDDQGVYHSFNVLSHINKIRAGETNNGWVLRLQNEPGTSSGAVRYASSEHSSDPTPKLTITYYLPISITATVQHCTNGMSDGSIQVSIDKGSGTYTSYVWYELSSGSYTTVESGTNIANADVNGLDPGAYLLEVEDDEGNSNYKYFLVGEEDATTTVSLYWNDATKSSLYNEDATVDDYPSYVNTNYSNHPGFYTFTNYYSSVSHYRDQRSYSSFKIDFDHLLNFSQADYKIYTQTSYLHYRNSSGSNAAYVSRVTQPWDESKVTYTNKPSVTTQNRISLPSTVNSGYVDRDDVLDLSDFVDYWQANPESNYGIELALQSFHQTYNWNRLSYGSSDNSTAVDRPKFELSFTVKPKTVTSWDEASGTGDITVNAPGGELPYTYIVSKEPVENINSLWIKFQNEVSNNPFLDTTILDSSEFFSGKINDYNHTFYSLYSGEYYITVFDNNGEKIMEETSILKPSFELIENTDIEVVDEVWQKASGASGDGKATLLAVQDADKNGGFEYKVVDQDEYLIGFQDFNTTQATTASEIEYGIHSLSTGELNVIINGVEGNERIPSTSSDRIKLVKKDNNFSLYINGDLKHTSAFNVGSVSQYKLTTILKGSVKLLPLIISFPFSKPKPSIQIQYPQCGQSFGALTINTNIWIDVTNVNVIPNHQGLTFDSPVLSGNNWVVDNMDIGTYTVKVTYSLFGGIISGLQYTEQVPIGYVVEWGNLNGLTLDPNPNNLIPTSPTVTGDTYSLWQFDYSSYVNSFWIHFDSKILEPGVPFSGNAQLFEISQSYNNNADLDLLMMNVFPWFADGILLSGGSFNTSEYSQYFAQNHANYIPTQDGSFRIEVDPQGNNVALYREDNNLPLVQQNSITDDKIFIGQYGTSKFIRVISSFCPIETPDLYVTPKRNIEGGYYLVPLDDILRFEFEEEYAKSGNIKLVVRGADGFPVPSGNPLSSVDLEDPVELYGDNREKLDVSSLSAGYYLLELSNDKNEKWFLRFEVQ